MPNSLGTAFHASSTVDPEPRLRDEVHSENLTIKEMLRLLVTHGCSDLTSQVDPEGYSEIPLGEGGHGDVWKGRMQDGRDIAVKVWRQFPKTQLPKVMKRTMQEIYYWSKIKHENIHELMGVTERYGKLGVVSLWMEHGDLRGYIAKNPTIDRYPWCIQVAAGVSYLHQEGLIHGDMKASNVLVSKDCVAKISDFDCSFVSDCSILFSATEGIRTSLRWAAPELMGSSEDGDEDENDINLIEKTKPSDIYALAMTLLEIISGKSPYAEYKRDVGVLKAMITKKLPKRPEELSISNAKHDTLWRLLIECWNHDYMARPDARTVLEGLRIFSEPPEVRGPELVGPNMSVQDMLNLLLKHGCADLSSHMDLKQDKAFISSGGGFGDIFTGDLYNGAKVAIKTLRGSIFELSDYKQLKRTAREIYVWSKLKHENIHELMGVVLFKGHYLGGIPVLTATNSASAVEYMHEYGVVHSDIKASNILVSADGTVRLTDFVLSIMSEISIAFSHTDFLTGGGTLRWMAPELLSEEVAKSKPSGVYALGMTILEILTGVFPYTECPRDVQVISKIMRGILPTRPIHILQGNERGNKMWELLVSFWDQDPAVRPTASQVLESLNAIAVVPA